MGWVSASQQLSEGTEPPCQISCCLGSWYHWLCFASINTARTYSLNGCANLRRENTSSVLEQCYFLPNSSQCARLEMHQLLLGLLLLNSMKIVTFPHQEKEELVCFPVGNVPWELGCSGARSSSSAVVPNRGHSQTGDKGSHHLQLLLAHPGDGVEGTGSPCLHTAGSLCHLVELRGV